MVIAETPGCGATASLFYCGFNIMFLPRDIRLAIHGLTDIYDVVPSTRSGVECRAHIEARGI